MPIQQLQNHQGSQQRPRGPQRSQLPVQQLRSRKQGLQERRCEAKQLLQRESSTGRAVKMMPSVGFSSKSTNFLPRFRKSTSAPAQRGSASKDCNTMRAGRSVFANSPTTTRARSAEGRTDSACSSPSGIRAGNTPPGAGPSHRRTRSTQHQQPKRIRPGKGPEPQQSRRTNKGSSPAPGGSGAQLQTCWNTVEQGSGQQLAADSLVRMYRESLVRVGGRAGAGSESHAQVAQGVKLPITRKWTPLCWRLRDSCSSQGRGKHGGYQESTEAVQRNFETIEMMVQYSNSKYVRVVYSADRQSHRVHRLLAGKFPISKLPLGFEPPLAPAHGPPAHRSRIKSKNTNLGFSNPRDRVGQAGQAKGDAVARPSPNTMANRLAKRMSMCRDTRGRRYDIKKLRARRFRAVMRGMTWMFKFLKKDNFKRLYELGDDMPSIFFECWYTSADTRIRTRAKGIAKVLVQKLETQRLAKYCEQREEGGEAALDENVFFECMFMLRCKHEMGLDCEAMLKVADAAYRGAGLADTNKMFDCDDIFNVDVDKWLLLLMRVLIVEYMNLIYRNRWPIQWGMKECFLAIRDLQLKTWKDEGDEEEYDDAFYLATHIVFAISAYSATKTDEKDVPWLYAYIRGAFKFWRKFMKFTLPGTKRHDPEHYIDIDAIGEILDNLRGAGLNDASDPMVCELSVFLLDNQNKNGSFPAWFRGGKDELDTYDQIHSTWVCTQALRDRDFKIKENFKWVQWMNRLLKTTQFGVLNYTPTWAVRKTEFSYEGLTYTHLPGFPKRRKSRKKSQKKKRAQKPGTATAPIAQRQAGAVRAATSCGAKCNPENPPAEHDADDGSSQASSLSASDSEAEHRSFVHDVNLGEQGPAEEAEEDSGKEDSEDDGDGKQNLSHSSSTC